MTSVFYDGHTFKVPLWANYLVQNPDGSYIVSAYVPVREGDVYISDRWEYILPIAAQTNIFRVVHNEQKNPHP